MQKTLVDRIDRMNGRVEVSEKRRSTRRQTNRRATILLGKGTSSPCVIADESKSGLRLIHRDDLMVGSIFHIKSGFLGKPRPARTVWRSVNELGAEFIRS